MCRSCQVTNFLHQSLSVHARLYLCHKLNCLYALHCTSYGKLLRMTYKDATIKTNGRNKRQGKNPFGNDVMYALLKTDATNLTYTYMYLCLCILNICMKYHRW